MSATVSTSPPRIPVRRIGTDDLRWALSKGWADFNEKRGDLLFIALLYPLIGLMTAVFAWNDQLLPLIFPLVAGLSILGPAVASGFYELARRREEGREASWRHFFDPLLGRGGPTIVWLTIGLAGLFVAWLTAAYLIYLATMGPDYPAGIGQFVERVFTTPSGWMLIVLGNLTGAVFATIVLAVSVVSFPLAVDLDSVDATTAIDTSLRAFGANTATMLGWGARVAGLLVLGSLPAFIGLAVVLPVLGYATWHLYTRLVAR